MNHWHEVQTRLVCCSKMAIRGRSAVVMFLTFSQALLRC